MNKRKLPYILLLLNSHKYIFFYRSKTYIFNTSRKTLHSARLTLDMYRISTAYHNNSVKNIDIIPLKHICTHILTTAILSTIKCCVNVPYVL